MGRRREKTDEGEEKERLRRLERTRGFVWFINNASGRRAPMRLCLKLRVLL